VRKQKRSIILENVLVEDYAAEGKSLARVDGKVVFIEYTVPGDVVDVQLVRSKKDWAEGYPLQFRKYSKERVPAFCSHFGVCGGCQWQMLPYEKQLFYKQKQVNDNLSRIAKVELPPLLPIIGADVTRQYRNKLEYTFANKKFISKEEFGRSKNQEPTTGIEILDQAGFAGFHAKGVFDKIVEITTCHLQAEPTNEIRNEIARFGVEHHLSFYDIKSHHGLLRNVIVRMATTGELMVNIILACKEKENQEMLLDFVMKRFPQITTLLYTINTKFNDTIYDLHPQIYHGKGFIIENLEDFKFKISPKSFFQTNTRQAEKLYGIVRNFAELTGIETVYDLYCGTGSIGIFVSKQAKKVIGVEMVAEAIEDAKVNAAFNNILHSVFIAGDVVDVCTDDFFTEHGKPDVVITDPPRAGMQEKLVKKLLDIAAPTIVYVSCNPATQARDIALLDEKYEVAKIQPVDMFPHTLHIENVMQLKLRSNN
jgi:23S rRNA (uracil1939-C5)-methyltransferase